MKSLYALLHPESMSLLKDMFKSAPFSTLDVPALYIGSSEEDFEVRADLDVEYSAIPTQFFLGKNPFTGNTSLILNLDLVTGIEADVPGTIALASRAAEFDSSQLPPCIFVSDGIAADLYEVLPDTLGGGYVSDHAPVMAIVKFEK
jgi:hypothetical protein